MHWKGDNFRLYYQGGDGGAWESVMARFEVADGAVKSVNLDLLESFNKLN